MVESPYQQEQHTTTEVDYVQKWGNQVERSAWTLVFFSMMTQVSTEYAFPSYNIALGFWGAHCAFSTHGRATFGLLSFTLLGCVLDVVFFLANKVDSPIFQFQIIMLVFCLLTKCYVLFCGSHYFASLGGVIVMDTRKSRPPQDTTTGSASTRQSWGPTYGDGTLGSYSQLEE
jgi:hypothetical protein